MHISKLQLVNYRNFARSTVTFKSGVNTIIGENGSGKTNLFRAIRLLLDGNLSWSAGRMNRDDFNRGLGKDWQGHWIIISLDFADLSKAEAVQALFLHGAGDAATGATIDRASYTLVFRPKAPHRVQMAKLEPGDAKGLKAIREKLTIDDYETVLFGKSTADFTDAAIYRGLVGDFEAVQFPAELEPPGLGFRIQGAMTIYDEVCFTYIQALRDVVEEFRNNRTNPLLGLLRSKSGKISVETMDPITALVGELNGKISDLDDVREVSRNISETIADAAGVTYSPSSLSIRSELPTEADRLFQSLKLFVGEADDGHEGGVQDLSLGGANLIYLTLKLLEFKYQQGMEASAKILLIEEPEAHIHTHIQKTLFERLKSYAGTQIIYSTHSTHISEVSKVDSINILARSGTTCEAYQPSIDLEPEQIGALERYLDAVRSNLLFAKSVILVEGDAEEILIPILVKKVLGISLDEMGVSLVNIRSTGFENISVLFDKKRIRKRCAIITDLDAATFDVTVHDGDTKETITDKGVAERSAKAGQERHARLTAMAATNPLISCHFAEHTFEVDFIKAGNVETIVAVVPELYDKQPYIDAAVTRLNSGKLEDYGPQALFLAKKAGKGWFAVMLGRLITAETVVPGYILDALLTVHAPLSPPTLAAIIDHRLGVLEASEVLGVDFTALRAEVDQFRQNKLGREALKASLLGEFSAGPLAEILKRV
jgi:putative ATP-dependent endonuclease of OLD family